MLTDDYVLCVYKHMHPETFKKYGAVPHYLQRTRDALEAAEAERASAPPQPCAPDDLIAAINDAKMLFNHAGVGTSAQNHASKVVTFLKSLQAPGADAGMGEAVATDSTQEMVTIPRKSADKAIRAMVLCERECSGWLKYAKPIYDALASPPHPSATNNVSHPAVREPTENDASAFLAEFNRVKDIAHCSVCAAWTALGSIHAVIAEAGVAK